MFDAYFQQASDGELLLDSSGVIQAHEVVRKWLEQLKGMYNQSLLIPKAQGFSDLNSAMQLAAKFDKKATDPELGAGLQERLNQFIEVGEELSELFLKAIQHFEAEDNAAASNYLAMHGLSDKQSSELKTRYQQLNPIQQPR
ncbi:MAG: hypothetical protein LLG14_27005 [Nocardiaceae bacterium]|nr:hypothetical protein [Nocardiaceae bacterium]